MPNFNNSIGRIRLNGILALFCFCNMAISAQEYIGIFNNALDIGNPALKGTSMYDSDQQVYTLKGAGYNIWFERDEFHYLFNEMDGDFILTANFSLQGEGQNLHRKVGWMVRSGREENDQHISAVLHGDGLTVLQWRSLKGAYMRDPQDEIFATKSHYDILQLERKGKTYIMRAAHKGEPLQLIGSKTLNDMPEQVLAGLFICSHNADVIEEARVWNVRIEIPVPTGYNAYSDGRRMSRLETVHIDDGHRKIIHEDINGFEAPNWMPDDQHLLINQDGSLFKIPLEGGFSQKLNTGFADRNNNDHGISFGGDQLAISHHVDGRPEGGSTIYIVPVEGGVPREITPNAPSYWHGWSADDQKLYFTGLRPGQAHYQIYEVDIQTKEERQLTHVTRGLADGPEATPDGKYIYYNSSETGTMQIWRMHPDGSSHEQITYDQYNDWFPHISPDGKWIVFLSFDTDVQPDDHPFYKRVMLRLMPLEGGPITVLAHLYGGQGTINVPSWSPDSKKVAFVSNSFK